jgi:SAM-dependent methyltransferase
MNNISNQPTEFDPACSDLHEPLAESAMLALEWSKNLCSTCGSYHGAWQLLRLLGVFNSMRSDDDFLIRQLFVELGAGARKILVSGAADYALMARISAVAKQVGVAPQITVVDLCRTPLELNRWYAEYSGMDVELLCGDILDLVRPGRFDLVCTHSFLCFFDKSQREKLATVWWDCLAPGGAVITAQRVRPDDPSERHGFTATQISELGERAYQLAVEQFSDLQLDPDLARSLAEDYAADRNTYVIQDSGELGRGFSGQGFLLEHFATPAGDQPEKDTPSTPTGSGHHRWRILARKPVL